MAIDEALLDAVAAGDSPPTLRFYGWAPPAVSVGRFQALDSGIDLDLCRRRGWDVVRRPTGGRAVLHDEEITFSIAVPVALVAGAGVLASHCLFVSALNQALVAALPALGAWCLVLGSTDTNADTGQRVDACTKRQAPGTRRRRSASCFAAAAPSDSLVGGRKLVGTAQARRSGALLQQGSLLLAADREAWRDLFGEPQTLVTLAELLSERPPAEELARRLAAGLAAALAIRLEPAPLTSREAAAVAARPCEGSLVDTPPGP
jgi:lipoate-protein ligase A